MITKEAYDKLLYDIRIRMAGYRTFLGVPELEDRAIDELRFLAKLMRDIGTEESLQSSEYMLSIIQKALDGTFEIGD